MQENIIFRRIMLGLYLFFGLSVNVIYGIIFGLSLNSVELSLPTRLILSALLLLTFLAALGLLLFDVLFFRYRARNLFWLLFPFLGGLIFGFRALFSKKAPQAFRLAEKSWNIWALFGLLGLDQTTGMFFGLFPNQKALAIWQIVLDLLLLAATIAYFVYWGRKRARVQWRWQNIWHNKWWIILALAAMTAFAYLYPWLLNILHLGLPMPQNQAELNSLAQSTPAFLMWIHLAVGAPIMEETIFRAGIYELVSPKHPKIALFVSAILFASIHLLGPDLLNWKMWLIYLVPGFALAGLYYKTRKVEATMTVHFIWNGLLNYFLP